MRYTLWVDVIKVIGEHRRIKIPYKRYAFESWLVNKFSVEWTIEFLCWRIVRYERLAEKRMRC